MKTDLIRFHDTTLIATVVDGKPHVAVKPICDSIGLDTNWAVRKIKIHKILSRVRCLHTVHDASGRLQEMVLLPIHHVHGWLFSIDSNRVKKECEDKLLSFQEECFQVLFDHFYGSTKKINENLTRRYEVTEKIKAINKQIHDLMMEHKTLGHDLMMEHKTLEVEIKRLDSVNYAQLNLFESILVEVPYELANQDPSKN